MFSTYQHSSNSIRFRRWNRAGYAVFCSLGNDVTIGCLDIAISDKSLQKSFSKSSNTLKVSFADVDSEIDDLEESALDLALFNLKQAVLSESTFGSVVACAYTSFNSFIHHSG